MKRTLRSLVPTLPILFAMGLAHSAEAMTPPPSWAVFFETGTTEYWGPQAAENTLRQFATAFKMATEQRTSCARLAAHTDSAEGRSYPADLSAKRGETVKNRLVRLGVPAHLIKVQPYGDSVPLVRTAPGEAEPQNRNVMIHIVPYSECDARSPDGHTAPSPTGGERKPPSSPPGHGKPDF